jgi:hypothetical protein
VGPKEICHNPEGEEGAPYSKIGFFSYSVVPYFEYLFSQGPLRPFIGLTFGLEGISSQFESESGLSYEYKTKSTLFVFGGTGGVQSSLSDSVSLDLTLLATYGFGKNRLETAYQDPDGEVHNINSRTDISRFRVDVKLGLSGWF